MKDDRPSTTHPPRLGGVRSLGAIAECWLLVLLQRGFLVLFADWNLQAYDFYF
jgi:hypothetical protein